MSDAAIEMICSTITLIATLAFFAYLIWAVDK